MADFSVYGTIYNNTYYNFPKPTAEDPSHGSWATKPPAINAGKNEDYHLKDNAGCHGSEAVFYLDINQMDFKWAVLDGYTDHNYVHTYGMTPAAVLSFEAKSGDMTKWDKGSCPETGHPLYVRHYVAHNPEYLLPYGTQQKQLKSFWCWATCISVLYAYYRNSGSPGTNTQCALATKLVKSLHPYENYDCCKPSTPVEVCDIPAQQSTIVANLSNLGLSPSATNYAPSLSTLESAFDNFTPVVLGIIWNGGIGGHLILAHGYEEINNIQYINVMDPGYGTIRVSFSTLMYNYQNNGSVRMYITTSYKKPWSALEENKLSNSSKMTSSNNTDKTIFNSVNVAIASLPPTLEALTEPTKHYQVGRGQLREVRNSANQKDTFIEFAKFDAENNKVENEIYTDQEFVRNLWDTYTAAYAYARQQKEHYEAIFVPLPHLRVDAVAVFSPHNLDQKAIFVVPKIHEKKLEVGQPLEPTNFWNEMQKRHNDVINLPEGSIG